MARKIPARSTSLRTPSSANCFGGAIAHVDGAIFKNNFVCGALGAFEDFVGRLGTSQINGAEVRPKMKGDRWPPVALLKHGREQVLSGVLLHVIEAARPVDAAEHIRTAGLAVDDMNDFVAFIAHVEHVGVADFAQIVWLASRGRVERGAIQNQAPDLCRDSGIHVRRKDFAMHDPRVEFCFESVVVIESAVVFIELVRWRGLQRALPGFGVFVAGAGVEQHDGFFRLDPARGRELSSRDHRCSAFGSGKYSFERSEFLPGLQHLFVGDRQRGAVRLAEHASESGSRRAGRGREVQMRESRHSGKIGRKLSLRFPCFNDGRATFGLYRHHPRPFGTDPAHLLHFVKRFAHADQADAAASGIQNYVRQFARELLPKFVAHGLLAFDAVGLFEGRNVVPAFAVFVLGDIFAAIGD